jgi:hypothetical protein
MVLQNQMVFGTVNAGPDAFENAISALAEFEKRWPVPLAALITGRYPMEKARELLQDGSGGIKDVIQVRS